MIKEMIQTFRKPSAMTLAQTELEHAEREYLAAMNTLAYSTQMVQYRRNQITNLKQYLEAGTAVPEEK